MVVLYLFRVPVNCGQYCKGLSSFYSIALLMLKDLTGLWPKNTVKHQQSFQLMHMPDVLLPRDGLLVQASSRLDMARGISLTISDFFLMRDETLHVQHQTQLRTKLSICRFTVDHEDSAAG